jgi:phosphatidylserine decarboxylase
VGWGAKRAVPSRLRPSAYRAFARAVGADLREVELDLSAYATFGDFFVRRLQPGARPIDPAPDAIVSPCDGVVAACGTSEGGTLIQAKGREYTLAELLANVGLAGQLAGGAYMTIYLSPRDYHRVHAPVAGRVVRYDYLPGALWPVKPWLTERRDRLLARNERVVITLDAGALGLVAVVMVGAGGVGNISLVHGPEETAAWRPAGERRVIELDAPVARGDELGAFHLGSTVVLAFAPRATAGMLGERGCACHGRQGQVLRQGERIGAMHR